MGELDWHIRRAVARLKKYAKKGGLESEGCKKTCWKKFFSRRFSLPEGDDVTEEMG